MKVRRKYLLYFCRIRARDSLYGSQKMSSSFF